MSTLSVDSVSEQLSAMQTCHPVLKTRHRAVAVGIVLSVGKGGCDSFYNHCSNSSVETTTRHINFSADLKTFTHLSGTPEGHLLSNIASLGEVCDDVENQRLVYGGLFAMGRQI